MQNLFVKINISQLGHYCMKIFLYCKTDFQDFVLDIIR